MKNSHWTVYIIECADSSLYTGITVDIDRRVNQHDAGIAAKYTKGRGPVKIVYTETCANRGVASSREAQIKRLPRVEKLKLIKEGSHFLGTLS